MFKENINRLLPVGQLQITNHESLYHALSSSAVRLFQGELDAFEVFFAHKGEESLPLQI